MALWPTDPRSVAKALADFARTGLLELRGGVLDGRAINAADATRLATLPPRIQLLARPLVSGLELAIAELRERALHFRGLVVALDQIRQQKEAAAAGAALSARHSKGSTAWL